MLKLFPRLMLVVGLGMTGAACPRRRLWRTDRLLSAGTGGYGNPYYNSG